MFDSIAEDKPKQIYLGCVFLFLYDMVTKKSTLDILFFTQLYYINLIAYSMYQKQVEFLMGSIIWKMNLVKLVNIFALLTVECYQVINAVKTEP